MALRLFCHSVAVTSSIFCTSFCDDLSSNLFEDLIPSRDRYMLKKHKNFLIYYDCRTRNPVYVIEHLQAPRTVGKGHKRPNFFTESIIDEDFVAGVEDFKESGYDRGHMAPAADFKDTYKEYKATFSMSNISPQHPVVNRGIWKSLENWTRDLLGTCDSVMVISGPAYIPTKVSEKSSPQLIVETIGTSPKLIHVPTHFFKVVLTQKKLNSTTVMLSCAAFLVPNLDPSEYLPYGTSLSPQSFLVKIRDLEGIVGLRFLPNFVSPDFSILLDAAIQEGSANNFDSSLQSNSSPKLSSRTHFLFHEVFVPRRLNLDNIPIRNKTLLESLNISDRVHYVQHSSQSIHQFCHLCSSSNQKYADCKKELGKVNTIGIH